MDLQQLQFFVRVAEQRSVSDAAVLLNVSQPTVSRAIRLLETELRASLFRRNGRGVQLTPAGRRFLDCAHGVLRSAEVAREAVHEGGTRQTGRVVIGVTPSLSQMVVPEFLERFVKRFPHATCSVVQGLSDDLAEQILAGKLDFAVLRNVSASSQLTIEPITNEEIYLIGREPVGGKDGRVSLHDIARLPLIMPSSPNATRPMFEAAMARRGLTARITYEIDSVPAIMRLVARGFGYSMVPETTCMIMPPELGLHAEKIDAPELSTPLCFAAPARPPRSTLVSEAAEELRAVVANTLASSSARRAG